MITLTLLHPVQSTPVQSWSFEQDPAIRIGRAVDNHVVLYSAVVSRYHVEIRLVGEQWEVVNLGTNGTYLDGKRIHQAPLTNGSIMRLARSGPNIQIYINENPSVEPERSPAQSSSASGERLYKTEVDILESAHVADHASDLVLGNSNLTNEAVVVSSENREPFYVEGRYPIFKSLQNEPAVLPEQTCNHQDSAPGSLICTNCGFPVQPLRTIGPYQVLKSLNTVGNTLLAWRDGHTVVLKTLRPEWRNHPDLIAQFEEQARLLCQLEHPGMPKFFEAFELDRQPYLVSEMIHGPNLGEWVRKQGPISQYQAVQWALELCRLLDYLHTQTQPYIHCRLQPSNLIRPRVAHGSSQVVLVSFCDLRGLTPDSGTLSGSIGYASPEQHIGSGSPGSDLYGLGATLVYLLTGQEPDAFYKLGDDEFRLDVQNVPNISPEMAGIIQRLTHPQADQRFASAAAALEALQPLL
ncbi:MAG TPA: FHA domain-containing serine/threonine-protein kinase [Stenomitos sp.]